MVLVDGGWSSWSEWGSCAKSCGQGIKIRNRQCNNPPPQNNGKNCGGMRIESTSCNVKTCPGILLSNYWFIL